MRILDVYHVFILGMGFEHTQNVVSRPVGVVFSCSVKTCVAVGCADEIFCELDRLEGSLDKHKVVTFDGLKSLHFVVVLGIVRDCDWLTDC